jgi:drug/metabolite transporter (DMT)-like permease
MTPPLHRGALLVLMGAMTLTGANVPLAKVLAGSLPLYAFLAFRFAVASMALLPLAHFEAGPRLRDMPAAALRDVAAMSLVGMLGYTVLIFEGVRRTSAVDAGIITATLPAVAAVISVLFLRDRLARMQWGAVALAVAGLMLVQAGARDASHATLVGNLLVMGAVLCEAGFVIIGKRLAPPYRPFRLSLGANLVGLLLSLPLMLIEGRAQELAALPRDTLLAATWYVLSASVIALWLWYRGLPHVPAWLAGLATAALPVSALVVSFLLLGENLDAVRVVGALCVLASIALGALTLRR